MHEQSCRHLNLHLSALYIHESFAALCTIHVQLHHKCQHHHSCHLVLAHWTCHHFLTPLSLPEPLYTQCIYCMGMPVTIILCIHVTLYYREIIFPCIYCAEYLFGCTGAGAVATRVWDVVGVLPAEATALFVSWHAETGSMAFVSNRRKRIEVRAQITVSVAPPVLSQPKRGNRWDCPSGYCPSGYRVFVFLVQAMRHDQCILSQTP